MSSNSLLGSVKLSGAADLGDNTTSNPFYIVTLCLHLHLIYYLVAIQQCEKNITSISKNLTKSENLT